MSAKVGRYGQSRRLLVLRLSKWRSSRYICCPTALSLSAIGAVLCLMSGYLTYHAVLLVGDYI